MFSFIRRHWVAYLIGALVALALGFGAAWYIGVKGSLPEDVRAERIASEKAAKEADDEMRSDTGEDDDSTDTEESAENTSTDEASSEETDQSADAGQEDTSEEATE